MRRNSSNDVAWSTTGHRISVPPTNIPSSSDPPFPTKVQEGSVGSNAPEKGLDQAPHSPCTTNPQDSIVVPKSQQVLEGNNITKAAFPPMVVSTPSREPRHGQTLRYNHVPLIHLEMLLDNAASLTKMLQHMEQGRRPSLRFCREYPVGIRDGRDDINQSADEVLDDGSSSVTSIESDWIDDTAKYSPSRSRSAVAWRHYFQNHRQNAHQSTYTMASDFDMSRRFDDIAPTA